MVSRREFLRSGSLVGLASTLPAGKLLATPSPSPASATGCVVVCDTRYPEGDRFLAALDGSAYLVTAPGNDAGSVMTSLAEPLDARRPLLGLTTDATLMVVEQLARERGYQVTYSGIHRHLDDRNIQHDLEGDARWIGSLADRLREENDWGRVLGILGPALLEPGRNAKRATVTSAAPRPTGSPGHLVSWAMAPVAG